MFDHGETFRDGGDVRSSAVLGTPSGSRPDEGSGTASAGALLGRVEAVRAELTGLGAASCGAVGWAARDRAAVWSALDSLAGAVTAARSAWLVVERAAGTLVGRSDVSEVAAVDRRTGCGRAAAHGQVRAADALAAMPAVARQVAEGRVGVAHLDALGRVLQGAPEPVTAVLTSATGQAKVLELAAGASAPTFAKQVARWAAELDPMVVEDAHQAQRRARYLHLSDQADGLHLKGLLDRFSGEYLRRALDLMGQHADDDRTVEQARADALEALAAAALATPTTTTGACVRPHVTLVVDAATFAAVRGTGTVPGSGRPFGPVPPALTEDGVPVAMSELARTLCDADMSRLVMSAESEPLDLGRTARFYTGALRRAVIIRDQTCIVGQCAAPARRCEVHHIRWWERDAGPTSIEVGALTCIYHHHWIHAENIAVRRLPPDATVCGLELPGLHGLRPRPVYECYTPEGTLVARTGERGIPADGSASRASGITPGGSASQRSGTTPDGSASQRSGTTPDGSASRTSGVAPNASDTGQAAFDLVTSGTRAPAFANSPGPPPF